MNTGHDAVTAYVGMGSNMGDSAALLHAAADALAALPGLGLRAVSPLYRSQPQGLREQPFFFNRAAALNCPPGLAPEELLDMLQAVEAAFGRDRRRERRFGPRPLDLDLLLFGNRYMTTGRLTLPHPRMLERAFVLLPLADIAPGLHLPDGRSVRQALALLDFRLRDGIIWQDGPAAGSAAGPAAGPAPGMTRM